MSQITDVPFDDALDVQGIRYRFHPLDVGFDLRAEGAIVPIALAATMRVSYPARDGSRWVMEGPQDLVARRLRQLGFRPEVKP